ncbi:MAG: hypothetical protein QM765_04495 [Myxococcales bacterium]
MKRTLLSSALAAALATACTPSIEQKDPPALITAQFDVSATPPVVPTPNDLAMNPKTGLVTVPLSASASAADQEFAAYLGTLDGFPASSSATATFDGELDPATVTADNVVVNDITVPTAPVPVTNATIRFLSGGAGSPSTLAIAPPAGGWTGGHHYAVVLLGTAGDGVHGLKGAKGETVVGSSLWALIRSRNSLVHCPNDSEGKPDLTSPKCVVATSVIPTDKLEAADRLADQTAKALQLEQLRLGLKPMFDGMENPPSCPSGMSTCSLPRALVALAWTFKITGQHAMVFDPTATPPAVPVPTDLAIDPTTGKINAPIDPSKSAAEQEFTRDYLNTLDGFPPATTGSALVKNGDLDPASITAQSVMVVDLTDMTSMPEPTLAYDAAKKALTIAPPEGGWLKGHHYAVAVVGGESGLKGTQSKGAGGKVVVASDVWALARSKASLVTCEDLTAEDCASTLSLAPLSAEQAVQLEHLRRGFEPVLDAFEALHGVARKDVAVAWTFQVLSQPEVLFNPDTDPAKAIIPFPNTLLLNAAGKVNLPVPADPETAPLYLGLNTLDGFSTTAPIVSENSLARGALDEGSLDEATVVPGAVGLMNLDPAGNAPEFKVCVDCAVSAQKGTAPQALQIVPTVPLHEATRYGAYVTTALKDADGKQVVPATPWALMRLENPLVDGNGKSTVSVLPSDRAAALEMLRLAFKPYIDALVAGGIARKDLALAWTFKTQTTYTDLTLINSIPTALGAKYSDKPDFLADITATAKATMTAGGIPNDKIAKVFAGEYTTPFLLTGVGGTINPLPTQFGAEHSPFLVVLPDTAQTPANGYPVVVFSHGITRNRTDALAIANTLAAAGFATISTDQVWHGDRSTCAGSGVLAGGACVPGDALCDGVTACDQKNAPGSALCNETYGKCVAADPSKRTPCDDATIFAATGQHLPPNAFCQSQGLGSCLPDQKCQAADFKKDARGGVVVSGWNFLNVANLFNTRDNFRQPTADLAQLYRVVSSTSTGTGLGQLGLNDLLIGQGAAAGLDKANYHFLGLSLGSMTGIHYVSTAPEVKRALFNVPGGDLATILQTSGQLETLRNAWLAGLAKKGMVPGTPAFDQYMMIARWILDPADPVNSVNKVLNGAGVPAERKAFIQYVSGDFFIPNPTTEALIASANRTAAAKKMSWYEFDGSKVAEGDRHGFLLNGKSTLTPAAQLQVMNFMIDGSLPTGAQP